MGVRESERPGACHAELIMFQYLAEEGTDYQLDLLVDKLIVDLNSVVDMGFVDLDNRDFEMVILND